MVPAFRFLNRGSPVRIRPGPLATPDQHKTSVIGVAEDPSPEGPSGGFVPGWCREAESTAMSGDGVIDKQFILTEIRRTAVANGGKPVGVRRFRALTGITTYEWGQHWNLWSDAQKEAGFSPNLKQDASDDEVVIKALALLTRDLGHFPTHAELRLKQLREHHPDIPTAKTLRRRFGGKQTLTSRVRDLCLAQGDEATAELCAAVDVSVSEPLVDTPISVSTGPGIMAPEHGWVYLVKANGACRYRIGRTDDVKRREDQHDREAMDGVRVIHTIETDDAVGVERYWHSRFKDKSLRPDRAGHSWYQLDNTDVRAFRRWKKVF